MVRTRNISRDKCVPPILVLTGPSNLPLRSVSRTARPYPGHTVRFSNPISRSGSLSEPPEAEPSRQNVTPDLLKNLLPALIRNPATYEETLSSICAAHNVDPSVVSAIKDEIRQGSSSRPLERYGYRRIYALHRTLTILKPTGVGGS